MFQCMNKRVGVVLVVVGAVVLSAAFPAVIQAKSSLDTRSAEVLESITIEQLKAVMEGEGCTVEVQADNVLKWKMEGMRATILLYKDGKSIQFYIGFGDGKATAEKVNAWNKTKRFSKSYLDDDGDPCLELDLDLAGGVTQARIESFIKTCRISVAAWCMEVVL